jgi:leucyl-tRNA synthetase
MMEYVNALRQTTPTLGLVEPLVVMLAPYAPHFAEECWERLGHSTSVMDAGWPSFDPALATLEVIEFVVLVTGTVRGRLARQRGACAAAVVAAATADPGIRKFLDGQAPKKVVFVPDRLVNLVV